MDKEFECYKHQMSFSERGLLELGTFCHTLCQKKVFNINKITLFSYSSLKLTQSLAF